MKTLNKDQILMLHDHLIVETGGSQGLRDDGMLEWIIIHHIFE